MSNPFSFNKSQFNRLFPFYILINKNLKVVSIGTSLSKLCDLQKDQNFNEFFSIPRPLTLLNSFDDLLVLQNQMVLIQLSYKKELTLRGQFEYMEDAEEILFLGSPWFGSIEQLRENNLQINDFAKNDPLIDLLHVLKTVEITNDDLKELVATSTDQKNELKKANKENSDIALFTIQNPGPIIRINYDGDILQNNPAASNLDFIEYEGETYRNDLFFKMITSGIDKELKKWNFEARSNEVDYSFDCVAIPDKGYINIYGRDITKQKINQQEIEKLSFIVQETTSSVVITDPQGKIEWVNKAFEKITGYNLSEAKGLSPGKLLQGEKTDQRRANYMREMVKHSKPFICEIYNYKKSGEGYWGRISAQPIFNKEGKIVNYFALKEDITFEKKAESKLDELRVFYEKILDNIPADIVVFDSEHRFLYVNPMGISDPKLRKWIIGKKDEDYVKERNKPISILEGRRKVFNSIMESKALQSWEEEFEQADGPSKYMLRNMFPVVNEDNEVDLIISYGVDITNIKKIQQQKEESEKKYREIIDNSLAIITTHDLQGKFIDANPMISKVFGYTDTEFINRHLTDFMLDEDKLLFEEVYLDKIKINKEATGIFRVKHKEGHIVYTLYNNYLKEEPGKEPYVIGFSVDITERILAEKELKKAKQVTEELAKTKHNFLANMSHEIRTPMNAIMGMSRQLLKSELTDEQRSYLGNITNASENLLVIINDVLDLAKLEAGKLSIEKIPFAPKEVMENVMKVMMHKAEEKGILLTNSSCDLDMSPVLIGDPFRINQIMLNLVSNSIKFTVEGSVDLSCKVLKDTDKFQVLEIKVADTGIGMEQSFLKDLFKKFSQEYESTSRKFGGTGLGMGITKNLIDNMDGEIIVESEKGKGTTIYVRFTLEKGAASDMLKKDTETVDTKNLKGKKILVVDDNIMNRMVATLILDEFEVIVSEAGDGEEAVEYLKNNACDLVLMDLQMPVSNGFDASIIIREKLKLDVPIIALTANVIKGEKEKCHNVGMNDYLSKPFDEDQFLEIICKWLEK